MDKLTASINHIDDMEDTEESITSEQLVETVPIESVSTLDDSMAYNKQEDKPQLITQYLINYNWDSLSKKENFKNLNISVPIIADINELIGGTYVNGSNTPISSSMITPDTLMNVWYMKYDGVYSGGLPVVVGLSNSLHNTGSVSGIDKYTEYCIDNNIWSIELNSVY